MMEGEIRPAKNNLFFQKEAVTLARPNLVNFPKHVLNTFEKNIVVTLNPLALFDLFLNSVFQIIYRIGVVIGRPKTRF